MLPAFFARVKPVSTIANPHCIKNTSAAPIKNQIAYASPLAASPAISVTFSKVRALSIKTSNIISKNRIFRNNFKFRKSEIKES